MKSKQTISILISFSMVAILFLSSSIVLGLSSDNSMKISSDLITSTSEPIKMNDLSISEENGSVNIMISNMTGKELNPSIVKNLNNLLVFYEYHNNSRTYVYCKKSTDYGQTWSSSPITFPTTENFSLPKVCIQPGSNQAYGAYISDKNNSSFIYEVDIQNIKNYNGGGSSWADWSYADFYNFTSLDIAYYEDSRNPNTPFIGACIGSTNWTNSSCQNSPMFFYRNSTNPDTPTIAWDPDVNNCRNISMDIDNSKVIVYAVCEILNGPKTDLFFIDEDPITNGEAWGNTTSISNQTLTYSESLKHPEILVDGDNIYITAETETQGILMFYSNDSGQNWTLQNLTKDILSPGINPKNPVLHKNETAVACIFTESGNLSIITTNNSGVNWSEPKQLNNQNGTVVDECCSPDIASMENVVWIDNREGSYDLYSFISYLPTVDLEVVEGSIKLFSDLLILPTQNRIEFEIRNNGTGIVEDVLVNITYECENETPVILSIPSCVLHLNGDGANKTYYKNLFSITAQGFIDNLIEFAGIESITVTVDPEEVTGDNNPSNNAVKIDVSYEDLFPKLYPLESLFLWMKQS